MKKVLLLVTTLCLFFPINAQVITQKIKKMDIPVEYNANKFNSITEISYKKMLNDVEEFCYIVETCYAGYDAAVKNGLNIDDAKQKVIDNYKKGQKISVDDLVLKIHEQFSPFIQDYHGYIGKGTGYRFITPTQAYFSNTYVKKENDKLYVVQSDKKSLQPGDEITCNPNLLFNYPAKGENVYRLGCLISKKSLLIKVQKDDIDIVLPINVVEPLNTDFEYFTKENENTIYIRYNRCYFNNETEYNSLVDFSNAAELCRNKETIILDIRGNPGGDDTYSDAFFNDLCFYQKDFSNSIDTVYSNSGNDNTDGLPMPNTVFSYMSIKSYLQALNGYVNMENEIWKGVAQGLQKMLNEQKKNPQKIYQKATNSKINNIPPLYKGKIIIITDNGVCSSGESIVEQAYKYFSNTNQSYTIGTNTAGCGAFGNICTYYLSNSGIQVNFGITDFTGKQSQMPSFHGEGKGYNPDFWCTNEDIADTVYYITQDEETRDFVKEVLAK